MTNTQIQLRQWQKEFKFHFVEKTGKGQKEFLAAVAPGAGKTWAGLDTARDLISSNVIKRVVVVVPTDHLRQQWADEATKFDIRLKPVSDPVDYNKSNYEGCVMTYQQLLNSSLVLRNLMRTPTLVIFDEPHHAGDDKPYGDVMLAAFSPARYQLLLTGTPWRSKKSSRIPFIRYDDDGNIILDYSYSYGEAVRDGVCRQMEIHAYDGNAVWRDIDGSLDCFSQSESSANLTEVKDSDTGIALETVLEPKSAWMQSLLDKGVVFLEEMREVMPDSAGLLVADNKKHARQLQKMLTSRTGEEAALVLEDIPDSTRIITEFMTSNKRWIVAVRKVSEGVDISRIGVIIYATRARTPLLFQQIAGRAWRVRTGDEPNAVMLIPAIREMAELAREITDMLKDAYQEAEESINREREAENMRIREGVSSSEATLDATICNGRDFSPNEIDIAGQTCKDYGFPMGYVVPMAMLLRDHPNTGTQPPASPASTIVNNVTTTPQYRQERLLRNEVERLSRRYAIRNNLDFKTVNTMLLKEKFPPRKEATMEQLLRMRDFLVGKLNGRKPQAKRTC